MAVGLPMEMVMEVDMDMDMALEATTIGAPTRMAQFHTAREAIWPRRAAAAIASATIPWEPVEEEVEVEVLMAPLEEQQVPTSIRR